MNFSGYGNIITLSRSFSSLKWVNSFSCWISFLCFFLKSPGKDAVSILPNTLDESGYIKALEDCHTNVDGIFVAGDIRTKKVRQLVTATSDGAIAATEAIKYINKKA